LDDADRTALGKVLKRASVIKSVTIGRKYKGARWVGLGLPDIEFDSKSIAAKSRKIGPAVQAAP
jgi:hypothetical protein